MRSGPLRVIPGSHRQGYASGAAVGGYGHPAARDVLCQAGDVLLCSPLLLSSRPVTDASLRSVLRECCAASLADGLVGGVKNPTTGDNRWSGLRLGQDGALHVGLRWLSVQTRLCRRAFNFTIVQRVNCRPRR